MSRYDQERFDPAPDPDLVCCICQAVLDGPLETPCRHVFCKVCIETWLNRHPTCPSCRKNIQKDDLKTVLPIIQNMIHRLQMKCQNFGNGCTNTVALELIEVHEKDCAFEEQQCKWFKACGAKVLRKDKEQHEQECEHREIQCAKDCGLDIPIRELGNHNCLLTLKRKVKDQDALIMELNSERESLQQKVEEVGKKLEGALERLNGPAEDVVSDDSTFFNDNQSRGSWGTEYTLDIEDDRSAASEVPGFHDADTVTQESSTTPSEQIDAFLSNITVQGDANVSFALGSPSNSSSETSGFIAGSSGYAQSPRQDVDFDGLLNSDTEHRSNAGSDSNVRPSSPIPPSDDSWWTSSPQPPPRPSSSQTSSPFALTSISRRSSQLPGTHSPPPVSARTSDLYHGSSSPSYSPASPVLNSALRDASGISHSPLVSPSAQGVASPSRSSLPSLQDDNSDSEAAVQDVLDLTPLDENYQSNGPQNANSSSSSSTSKSSPWEEKHDSEDDLAGFSSSDDLSEVSDMLSNKANENSAESAPPFYRSLITSDEEDDFPNFVSNSPEVSVTEAADRSLPSTESSLDDSTDTESSAGHSVHVVNTDDESVAQNDGQNEENGSEEIIAPIQSLLHELFDESPQPDAQRLLDDFNQERDATVKEPTRPWLNEPSTDVLNSSHEGQTSENEVRTEDVSHVLDTSGGSVIEIGFVTGTPSGSNVDRMECRPLDSQENKTKVVPAPTNHRQHRTKSHAANTTNKEEVSTRDQDRRLELLEEKYTLKKQNKSQDVLKFVNHVQRLMSSQTIDVDGHARNRNYTQTDRDTETKCGTKRKADQPQEATKAKKAKTKSDSEEKDPKTSSTIEHQCSEPGTQSLVPDAPESSTVSGVASTSRCTAFVHSQDQPRRSASSTRTSKKSKWDAKNWNISLNVAINLDKTSRGRNSTAGAITSVSSENVQRPSSQVSRRSAPPTHRVRDTPVGTRRPKVDGSSSSTAVSVACAPSAGSSVGGSSKPPPSATVTRTSLAMSRRRRRAAQQQSTADSDSSSEEDVNWEPKGDETSSDISISSSEESDTESDYKLRLPLPAAALLEKYKDCDSDESWNP